MTYLRSQLYKIAALLCGLAVVPGVRAGSLGESNVGIAKFGAGPIREFTLQVNDELYAHEVNVGIIARCGRPRAQLPRGISYTHVAFVVYEGVVAPDHTVFYTYTVYNLYQDEQHPERSYLRQDFTYDFLAGIAERDVAVCVPALILQKRLLQIIRSPLYRALYHPEYNLTANPWVDRYDNCVTHTLKLCVAGIYQIDNPQRIEEDVRLYFAPTRLRLHLLESIGANFTNAIRQDDRDPRGYQTATYDSLVAFLSINHLVKETITLTLAKI